MRCVDTYITNRAHRVGMKLWSVVDYNTNPTYQDLVEELREIHCIHVYVVPSKRPETGLTYQGYVDIDEKTYEYSLCRPLKENDDGKMCGTNYYDVYDASIWFALDQLEKIKQMNK